MSVTVGSQVGAALAPVVGETVKELRGWLDEVLGGEEYRELRLKLADNLPELEAKLASVSAQIFERQIALLIQEAQGKDKIQRVWRPYSALTAVIVTFSVVIANLILFPVVQVVTPPEAWAVIQTLLVSVATLLGINVASRGVEKTIGTQAMGKLLVERPRPQADAKAERKRIRALKKAGFTPEQIMQILESEEG